MNNIELCVKSTQEAVFLKNFKREKAVKRKKFGWFMLGIVIFFMFLTMLIAPSSHGAEWRQKKLSPSIGEGTHFGICLGDQGHCGIIFYENESVRISSSFSGKRNDCFQNIFISPGGIVEKQLFCEDKKYSRKGKRICFDIYEEECRKHIDKLPSEYREKLATLDE
ncbi:MAG: hypothetical protein V3574_00965 [Candidatus Moraniibacteriota bacterium]